MTASVYGLISAKLLKAERVADIDITEADKGGIWGTYIYFGGPGGTDRLG